MQDRAVSDAATLNQQLQNALSSRVVLEQAKGVLAQQGQLSMEEPFFVLRQYPRAHHEQLTDVARCVVAREIPARVVLDHARARTGRR